MGLFSKKDKKKKNTKLKKGEIADILKWEGADGCFATNKITKEGCRVGYMYREKPDNNMDSGWRFFSGTESDEYVNNPDNVAIYSLNTICNYDKEIVPFLNAPYGSSFGRNKAGEFVEENFQN